MDSASLSMTENSNLQYHRHDERSLLRLLRDVAFQVRADFFFDHTVVGLLFLTGRLQGLHHQLSRAFDEAVFTRGKSPGHDFRRTLDSPRKLVDCDDGQHDAIFAQVAAILDDQVLDHVGSRAGINAHPAYVDTARL